jgi:hypothetical protein
MHHCKFSLPTPPPNAAETRKRANPESVTRPGYLPVNPESIPNDIKALPQWVSWKAKY